MRRHVRVVTFTGRCWHKDLLAGKREPTESSVLAMVSSQMGAGSWIAPPLDALATGVGRGQRRLVGGNLALIAALTGTRND